MNSEVDVQMFKKVAVFTGSEIHQNYELVRTNESNLDQFKY